MKWDVNEYRQNAAGDWVFWFAYDCGYETKADAQRAAGLADSFNIPNRSYRAEPCTVHP